MYVRRKNEHLPPCAGMLKMIKQHFAKSDNNILQLTGRMDKVSYGPKELFRKIFVGRVTLGNSP